ncbi:endonuclease/exonuclease/phosphatase family protein [Octadecabacter sp.]|nr:endonuclease/exonuclease/phosphatase family protein [Octadecabacter sp.]
MLWPLAASSEVTDFRIATYAAPLSRAGPGLLLQDILKGDDPQILATLGVINHLAPDILVLTDIDFDAGAAALTAFSQALAVPFPYLFAGPPNAGVQAGLDLDGDGRTGDALDALGYGRFFGDGGMAVLSRYPMKSEGIIDFTQLLWADVPNATLPKRGGDLFPSADVFETLPVSSTAHWIIPIDIAGAEISLLAFDATPPVFDGPEDFNGLRNHGELLVWEAVLDGRLAELSSTPVLIGNANIDPFDGDGLQGGINRVLAHPALQDPMPRSDGAQLVADPNHNGPPALDTADWPDETPGNLRVSYVLPAADLTVTGAGVFWPAPDDRYFGLLGGDSSAGAHHLVWVDLMIEGAD